MMQALSIIKSPGGRILQQMAREPNEHFGSYLYICPDWAQHVKEYAQRTPGGIDVDLEDIELTPWYEVVDLGLSQELLDEISSYGIVRYSYLDVGDDSCPTCKKQIAFEQAIEVDPQEAQKGVRRQSPSPIAPPDLAL